MIGLGRALFCISATVVKNKEPRWPSLQLRNEFGSRRRRGAARSPFGVASTGGNGRPHGRRRRRRLSGNAAGFLAAAAAAAAAGLRIQLPQLVTASHSNSR